MRAVRTPCTVSGTGRSVPSSWWLYGPGQLLEEERVALGLVEDQLCERVLGVRGGQQRPDDGEAVVRRQLPERQLRRERPIAPGRPIAGPIGRDQQDRRPEQALGEKREVLLGRPVDPVEVLHLEDERPLATPAQAHLPEGLEGPRLDDLGSEVVSGPAGIPPAQQAEEVGHALVGVQPPFLESEAHLLGDHLGRVGLGEPAVGAHDIHHGPVGDGRPVRETPPLKVGDAAPGEPLPELQQEPGLPDSGLADYPDGLTPALLHGGEEIQEGL